MSTTVRKLRKRAGEKHQRSPKQRTIEYETRQQAQNRRRAETRAAAAMRNALRAQRDRMTASIAEKLTGKRDAA